MPTPTDNSYILAELRDLRQAQHKTQVDIVEKLAIIQAEVAHYSDFRLRLEALEKLDAKRSGYLSVIAACVGTVSAIVVSILGGWLKTLLGI